ncbi:22262_t:CDS:1, partial [Dentiscutata erythropus]
MKRVFIPLFLQESNGCFDCQPGHSFKADWCLDLHGYLSRDEFAGRLEQINQYVQDIELMTHKTKKLLYYIASVGAILLSIIFLLLMREIGLVVSFSIYTPLFFIAKYMIEKNACERSIAFTNRLNELFARYNEKETPTVNWKFWWVSNYNRYVNNMDGRYYGNGHMNSMKFGCGLRLRLAALFVDNALIILEINDALSDLTANTVRVNIAPDTNYPNTAYPKEMSINLPLNNVPLNNVPINVNSAPINV